MANEFTCAMCGGTFEKAWTDEECKAEALEIFGHAAEDCDSNVVCDDCWLKVRPYGDGHARREARKA